MEIFFLLVFLLQGQNKRSYSSIRHNLDLTLRRDSQAFHIRIGGRPLKGRNILGCSGAISLHLHFRVLSGVNRFQINETGFETGFQRKVLKKSRTLRLKRVSDS